MSRLPNSCTTAKVHSTAQSERGELNCQFAILFIAAMKPFALGSARHSAQPVTRGTHVPMGVAGETVHELVRVYFECRKNKGNFRKNRPADHTHPRAGITYDPLAVDKLLRIFGHPKYVFPLPTGSLSGHHNTISLEVGECGATEQSWQTQSKTLGVCDVGQIGIIQNATCKCIALAASRLRWDTAGPS